MAEHTSPADLPSPELSGAELSESSSQPSEGGTSWTVPDHLDGVRLDKVLGTLAGLSRSKAKDAMDLGVRVNGRRAPKGSVVKAGDVVEMRAAAAVDPHALPDPTIILKVVYEDADVVVVDKPPRLATAPLRAGEIGTLVSGLIAKYPEMSKLGPPLEPGIVHRLDTDTSGLVIAARTPIAYDELRSAIRRGDIEKRYLAIVAPGVTSLRAASVAPEGYLPDAGEIAFPIAPHPKDQRRSFACVHPHDVRRHSPREASTHFKVLRRWEASGADEGQERALVEATADRALRHQIRVHLAAMGAPLLGDGMYGGPNAEGLTRHALHASHIGFTGSGHVAPFFVDSPLPADLEALLK